MHGVAVFLLSRRGRKKESFARLEIADCEFVCDVCGDAGFCFVGENRPGGDCLMGLRSVFEEWGGECVWVFGFSQGRRWLVWRLVAAGIVI